MIAIFWVGANPVKINLEAPVYEVEIVDLKNLDPTSMSLGAKGAAQKAPEPKPTEQAESKPEDASQEVKASPGKPEAKPLPLDSKTEAKPEPKSEPKPEVKSEAKPEAKAEPKPETKPEPKSEPKPEAKPEPKPDAKEISSNKEDKVEAKPEPKTTAQQDSKVEAKPQTAASQAGTKGGKGDAKSAKDELADALSSAKKSAATEKGGKGATKGGGGDIGSELADLRKTVGAGAAGSGGGASGSGTGGGVGNESGKAGLPAVYGQIVQKKVREKWRYPRIGAQSIPAATVRIRIDKRGKIVESRLVKSSGKPDYDASVLRALEEVDSLPELPVDGLEISINFNLNEMK